MTFLVIESYHTTLTTLGVLIKEEEIPDIYLVLF
jgi:hypothetical protein